MRKYIIIFVSGIISGMLLMYQFVKIDTSNTDTIKITQKSGKEIKHTNYKFSGDTIKFNTVSKGKGEIITEIPKENIPEANAWINKVHSVQLGILYQYHKSEIFPSMSLSYYRRFNVLSIGGGVVTSGNSAGIQAGIQYFF